MRSLNEEITIIVEKVYQRIWKSFQEKITTRFWKQLRAINVLSYGTI